MDVGRKKIPLHLHARGTGRQCRHLLSRYQPQHGEDQKCHAGQPELTIRHAIGRRTAIGLVQSTAYHHGKDGRHVGKHDNGGVGHADFGIRHQLRNHPVLGRTKKSALGAKQKHRQQSQPDVVEIKTGERHHHDQKLRLLHPQGHQLFAVTIGQLPRDGTEQEKRHHQRHGHPALTAIAQHAAPNAGGSQAKGEHLLQQVVIYHTKELGDDQRQESAIGQRTGWIVGVTHARATVTAPA